MSRQARENLSLGRLGRAVGANADVTSYTALGLTGNGAILTQVSMSQFVCADTGSFELNRHQTDQNPYADDGTPYVQDNITIYLDLTPTGLKGTDYGDKWYDRILHRSEDEGQNRDHIGWAETGLDDARYVQYRVGGIDTGGGNPELNSSYEINYASLKCDWWHPGMLPQFDQGNIHASVRTGLDISLWAGAYTILETVSKQITLLSD